jgi:3',5'-cyclic AMP phosphodiesterase CpdA
MTTLITALFALTPAPGFRVEPYLLTPTSNSVRVTWFALDNRPGVLEVAGRRIESKGERMPQLGYSELEEKERPEFPDMFPNVNVKHTVLIEGLKPGTRYRYTVTQGEQRKSAEFRTAIPVEKDGTIRFIAFADSETDPEGRTLHRKWTVGEQHAQSTGRPAGMDEYLVTETAGFIENLKVIRKRKPEFLVLSGDLVQGGGYQRAWDEFFYHLAGKFDNPLSSIPLLPAFGNWECFGARNGGYEPAAIAAARAKYRAYFDSPANNNPNYKNTYYRNDYGPITVITLDSSNGLPDDTDTDTNINIDSATYPANDLPDINPGSDQWRWAEAELKDARAKGQTIFVSFHHIPYSSGGHSLPVSVKGSSGQAGLPMRQYQPMFKQYGVVAVLTGHNEMFERSEVDGVLYYDSGVAGDGLGSPASKRDKRYGNPYRKWTAHIESPELWKGKQLVDGGKHYGHLEIEVKRQGGKATVTFTPVYVFPVTDETGKVIRFERREYADRVVRRAE